MVNTGELCNGLRKEITFQVIFGVNDFWPPIDDGLVQRQKSYPSDWLFITEDGEGYQSDNLSHL